MQQLFSQDETVKRAQAHTQLLVEVRLLDDAQRLLQREHIGGAGDDPGEPGWDRRAQARAGLVAGVSHGAPPVSRRISRRISAAIDQRGGRTGAQICR